MFLFQTIGLEFFTGIVVTTLGVFAGEWILWRTHDRALRRVVLFGALAVVSPIAVVGLTAFMNGFRVIDLVFRQGWYMHALLPILVVPPQLGLACGLFRPIRDPGALGWRMAAHVITLSFVTVNAINWCSPGYCGWFGFPFVFYQFTDAPSVIAGVVTQPPLSVSALFFNLVCLVGLMTFLTVVHWRTRGSRLV